MRQSAISAYRAANETVSAAKAIVMLFDGAIQRVAAAQAAIAENRIEDRYNSILKAYAIVQGLQSQLDFSAGGSIAPMLDRFYDYVLQRLLMVNLRNEEAICEELLGLLRQMRGSWATIANGDAQTAPLNPGTGSIAPAAREAIALVG